MKKTLTDSQVAVLRRIIESRIDKEIDDVEKYFREVDDQEREELCQLLTDEFANKGLKENDEPNSYGFEIESIIDKVCVSGRSELL